MSPWGDQARLLTYDLRVTFQTIVSSVTDSGNRIFLVIGMFICSELFRYFYYDVVFKRIQMWHFKFSVVT